jgi:hypothetical protein
MALMGLIASRGVFAAAPDTQYYVVTTAYYTSISALCASEAARFTAANNKTYTCKSYNTSYVTLTYLTGDATSVFDDYFNTRKWCIAANKAPDTSKALAMQCPDQEQVKKCTTAAGKAVTWRQFDGHSTNPNAKVPDVDVPYPTTSASCAISSVPDVVSCYTVPASDGGKDFYCNYTATSTGDDSPQNAPGEAGVINTPENATPGTTTVPASQTGGKCPGGTVQAGADSSGIPICIGSGTNPTNSTSTGTVSTPPTTTTAADGTKTTTSTTSVTNSDHSVTTTTTTTVTSPDGTVKTSQTSTTGNTPTGTPGKGDDSKDFCSANPQLTICQNSSVSGTCGQTSCQGDAIQCATLRAAAAMQCAQQQDTDALKALPQKALGDQIMGGNDPMAGQIADTLKGTDVDMSRVSFDQSGFLGGGTCLANRSFVVMGRAVPVDFTTVCNNIAPLRAVMMAVALIMSYLIVGRSVVGS